MPTANTKSTRPQKRTPKNKTRCAPRYRGGPTCFTESALREIVTQFNRHNSSPIKADTKKGMLSALKRRMPKCSENEMCWLNTLPIDVAVRLRFLHFAPSAPKKWRTNMDTWLTNVDIDSVMYQYMEAYPDFIYFSPAPIDFAHRTWTGACITPEICNFSPKGMGDYKRAGWVFNLDTHDGPGTHWVSLFADFKKKYIMYFDSVGSPCPREIRDFMDRIKREGGGMTEYETIREHQLEDGQCGMYALHFLDTHVTQKINGRKSTPEEISNYFNDIQISDKTMSQLRTKLFNM